MEPPNVPDDPSKPSLASQAAAGYPLFIPWSNATLRIGTSFESKGIHLDKGPWLKSSAFFDESSGPLLAVCELDAGLTSINEGASASSNFSEEHMSGSLGVTVGCAFLSGNVTGFYDETVTKLGNAKRMSKTISLRCGRIILNSQPYLSAAARIILETHGPEEFRNCYGDYYVAGYELGAEAGACLAIEESSRTSVEKKTVTATVEVLFWSASTTTSTTDVETTSEFAMTFCSYDTLDARRRLEKVGKGQNPARIYQAAPDALKWVACMEENVGQRIRSTGLANGEQVRMRDCDKICASGLVVRLILQRFTGLQDYVNSAEVASTAKQRALIWR